VALGICAFLVGWAAAGGESGAFLAVTLALDAVVSWVGYETCGPGFTWLSLPIIGLLGGLVGGLGAPIRLFWTLSVIISLTAAAFMKIKVHRLWISSLALGLVALGIALGQLSVWTLLSLLAIPRLCQSGLRVRSSSLWTEWAVVTLGALFVGHWIHRLIR
jgi:hypothetical protein